MDKQKVIETFTELQAVEIQFNIFTEAGASYKDWPYEVDSIEFSDVDYDMYEVIGTKNEYPEAIKNFAYAYFDLVSERFHASEGILIEAVHAYCKTLPEYQKRWKAIENEDSFLTVSATIQDRELVVIFER